MRADTESRAENGKDSTAILRVHDLIQLFDELSFRQKWKRVSHGLQQPRQSGEHKWARLQLLRLVSPILAVIVPVLLLFLIAVLSQFTPPPPPAVPIVLGDPQPEEKLDSIEQPIVEKQTIPDPIAGVSATTHDDFAPERSQPEFTNPPIPNNTLITDMPNPSVVPRLRTLRGPEQRDEAINTHVAQHTVPSVLRALRWLAVNQNKDGSWGNTKPAMTSLALLAYLAHGDTTASEEFGMVIEQGLRFLVDAQQPDGHFRGRDNHDYTQPIAAYALAEAYAMNANPQLREAAIKAIKPVVNGQNASGSWDYNLNPASTRNDLSYAGWCIQALKAASIAGLERDVLGINAALDRAVDGIKVNFRADQDIGGFGYTSPSATHGLTGVGVLALQFLGESQSQEARMGLAGLHRWPFDWKNPRGRSPVYWWYYNTQAYFNEGGEMWEQWNNQFSHTLVDVQNIISADHSNYVDQQGKPQEIGYWDSPAQSELTGGNGRMMDTILCTLMLEVYYRNLYTFRYIRHEETQPELGDEGDLVIQIVRARQ